jgi:hypothetical protein
MVLPTTLLLPIFHSSYDLDDLLAYWTDVLCPQYFPEGQECMLPLGPGVYGGGAAIIAEIVALPALPAILKSYLKGTFRIEATVTDAGGETFACLWVRVAADFSQVDEEEFGHISVSGTCSE